MAENPQDRMAERILAMGYTEAKRRRNKMARLDALTDATAAYCDVYTETPREKDAFFLPNVDVIYGDRVASGTIAFFDQKSREPMRQRCRELEGDWRLRVPLGLTDDQLNNLCAWWKDAISELEIELTGTSSTDNPEAIRECQAVDEATANLNIGFHKSLRYAFDAVVHDVAEGQHAYTLRVDYSRQRDTYTVVDDFTDYRTIGYCIPTSRAREVARRLEAADLTSVQVEAIEQYGRSRLDLLEELMRPDCKAYHSQSHSNVVTRTATLVRKPAARSALLLKDAKIAGWHGSTRWTLPRETWAALERAVWPSPPEFLYLMPLTNHEFVHASGVPRTLALWYVTVDPGKTLDPEELLAKRFRSSADFMAAVYERYCKAIGQAIAEPIVKGSPDVTPLSATCARIASVYGMSPVTIGAGGGSTLMDQLTAVIKASGGKTLSLSPRTCAALRELWVKTPSVDRSTIETDILLRVRRALDVAEGEQLTDESARAARERHEKAVISAQTFVKYEGYLRSLTQAAQDVRTHLDPLDVPTSLFDRCAQTAAALFPFGEKHEIAGWSEPGDASEVDTALSAIEKIMNEGDGEEEKALLNRVTNLAKTSCFADKLRHLKALSRGTVCAVVFDDALPLQTIQPAVRAGTCEHYLPQVTLRMWTNRNKLKFEVSGAYFLLTLKDVVNPDDLRTRAREVLRGKWPLHGGVHRQIVASLARGSVENPADADDWWKTFPVMKFGLKHED